MLYTGLRRFFTFHFSMLNTKSRRMSFSVNTLEIMLFVAFVITLYVDFMNDDRGQTLFGSHAVMSRY